jgi:hypothetical protein
VAVFPRQPRRLRYVSQASRLLKTATLFLNLLAIFAALRENLCVREICPKVIDAGMASNHWKVSGARIALSVSVKTLETELGQIEKAETWAMAFALAVSALSILFLLYAAVPIA